MPTSSLTTRLDPELKQELEHIARLEGCSVSSIANQAIQNLVDERKASRDILMTGLALIANQTEGATSQTVHDWLLADEAVPFPKTKP